MGVGGALLNRNTQCFKGLTQVNNIVRTEILHSHSDLNGHDTYLMDYFSGLHRYACKVGYTREILKRQDFFFFKKNKMMQRLWVSNRNLIISHRSLEVRKLFIFFCSLSHPDLFF